MKCKNVFFVVCAISFRKLFSRDKILSFAYDVYKIVEILPGQALCECF